MCLKPLEDNRTLSASYSSLISMLVIIRCICRGKHRHMSISCTARFVAVITAQVFYAIAVKSELPTSTARSANLESFPMQTTTSESQF